MVAVKGRDGRGRADSSGDDEGVVRENIGRLASCVSDGSGGHINTGGGGVMEDDRVLEFRVLLEAVQDGLEVLVVRSILHGDELTRRADVPPEVSRLVDNVQDVFSIFGFGELWECVLDDVVSSTQSGEVGPNDYDVPRLRHD